MVRPVLARQALMRWGRIFFSLRLTTRTRLARSGAATLAMARFSSDHSASPMLSPAAPVHAAAARRACTRRSARTA